MKNSRVVFFSIALVIFTAAWILFSSTPDKTQAALKISALPQNSIKLKSLQPQVLAKKVSEVTSNQTKPSIAALQEVSVKEVIAKDLQQFKSIKQKVFKSPSEESVLRQLFFDQEKLQNVFSFLTNKNDLESATATDLQAAVDLLIAAAQFGDTQLSISLVTAIIQDPQVENSAISKALRETLAGIKADLLYQASFIDTQTIQNSISGPVTEKIWENVKQAHAANLLDSENERRVALSGH